MALAASEAAITTSGGKSITPADFEVNPMTLLDQVRQYRTTTRAQLDAFVATAQRENRNLTADEATRFDAIVADVRQTDARLQELEADERRAAATAETRRMSGDIGRNVGGFLHTGGGEVYHRGASSPSYFRDLIHAQRGDIGAAERLRRNNDEVGLETRALGNTSGTGGSGGEFAPPAWITDEFVKLARPGRVTADLFHHEDLPPGVSQLNLPRVTSGTSTAIQSTQNTALSQTDMTTGSVSSGIATIGGKLVVSQQLLEQSSTRFDLVVLGDLTADYARQLGTQVLTGSGAAGQLRGYLTATSSNVVTWTNATPTATGFYGRLAMLQGQINSSRFTPPDTIVLSPRRWAWLASYTDSSGRPLVVPEAGGFNAMANPGQNVAQGRVGSVLGMDVYTDPNIPTNLGAGTNQDVVLMFVRDDIWLWESQLRAEAFTAPYSDSLGVLYRVWNMAALIPDRYTASLGQVQGTGLVTPTFAS